jgi:hypothetical protein
MFVKHESRKCETQGAHIGCAEAFTHLGFPAYFRVELSWAKLLGVVLLAPVLARLS